MKTTGDADSGDCRIALVDENAATQETLRALLAMREPGWRLEIYRSGGEALRAITEAPPHLVILEQTLPDGCGIACAQKLRARFAELPVVILATQGCPEKLQWALVVGVMGYVVKPRVGHDLLPYLRKAMEGRFALCEEAERLLPKAFAGHDIELWGLTRREEEVMLCLRRNFSDKETAVALGISTATVHAHLANLFKKLDVHSRKAAVKKFSLGGGMAGCHFSRTRLLLDLFRSCALISR